MLWVLNEMEEILDENALFLLKPCIPMSCDLTLKTQDHPYLILKEKNTKMRCCKVLARLSEMEPET